MSCETDDFTKLKKWHEHPVKRRFTVKCNANEFAELLTLSKVDFVRMQTEAKKFYDQLFQGGIIELQKTVCVRVAATDMCGR